VAGQQRRVAAYLWEGAEKAALAAAYTAHQGRVAGAILRTTVGTCAACQAVDGQLFDLDQLWEVSPRHLGHRATFEWVAEDPRFGGNGKVMVVTHGDGATGDGGI
jgi:hypothetical protein